MLVLISRVIPLDTFDKTFCLFVVGLHLCSVLSLLLLKDLSQVEEIYKISILFTQTIDFFPKDNFAWKKLSFCRIVQLETTIFLSQLEANHTIQVQHQPKQTIKDVKPSYLT